MHFRQLLISGFIMGAALFLAENAFAEKTGKAELLDPLQAETQANALDKANSSSKQAVTQEKSGNGQAKSAAKTDNSSEKVKESIQAVQLKADTGPASKNQSKVLPEQALNHTKKPVTTLGNGTTQANGKLQRLANLPNHIVPAAQGEKKGLAKYNSAPVINGARILAKHSFHPKFRVKSQSEKSAKSDEVMAKKENEARPLLPNPKSKKPSPDKEEIPKAIQVNNLQRINSSGGKSSDRTSQGNSAFSLLDMWFEWNKYYHSQLVMPLISRQKMFSNQWVNAPPSPPPQSAPFFLLYIAV